MDNLSLILLKLKRFDEALVFGREALEFGRQNHGNDHMKTLFQLNSLGHILDRLEQYDEAEGVYREVLETSKRVFGE